MTLPTTDSTTALAHATVVTVDADDTVLHDATVVMAGGTIVEVCPSGTVPSRNADRVVDVRGGIVLPGLVNSHAHLAMTLFRGFADDLDLQDFIGRLIPAETDLLTEARLRAGVRLAVAESLRAGCTTALDMYWFDGIAADEATDTGFRLETGPLFIGFDGADRTAFADRFPRARATGDHRWVMAHGTYTMDRHQLADVVAYADEIGARFHIHASENAHEVDDVRSRFGRTPIEILDSVGVLRPTTVLAHAVVLDDDEVRRLGETGTAIAHCPASNMKLASGLCRVADLRRAGAVVGLGTDGTSSSNDLDMFTAMRLASFVGKARTLDATALPARDVLRMATIDGARALGLGDEIGSVEVGKRADLVVLDADSPSLTPSFDAVSTVVYAASRADVVHVWAGGRQVVADRQLTTIDLPATLAAVREATASFR